ncbi:hypothetical protein ACQ4PT_056835 [Festuca glaucescens]
MALAFAGKAVAVSTISAIVRKSFEYLEKYTKAEGMKSVKEKLERTLPQVQVVFDAIDMERVRDQSEALDAWLWQLRDAVEEAEDVLDEVEYYKLERKVKTRDAMKKLDEVAAAVERFVQLVDRFDPSSLRHICHQEIDTEERVLNSLKPHINLAKLKIKGYNGRLPSLKYLYLADMDAVKIIEDSFYGCDSTFAFPSLKLLSIESLPSLEEWVEVEEVFRSLRSVQHLEIVRCSELSGLDGIEELASLTELVVDECEKLLSISSPQMFQASDPSQTASVFPSHLGRLRKLTISNPFPLQCEPLRRANSVTDLTIHSSSRCLPEEWLMQNCNHLKHLGVLYASQLECVPSIMARLTSLETLEFKRAIVIQSLPELPASLRVLQFLGCHPVLKQRCRKRRGHDWHKIAHIPDVRIEQDCPSSSTWHSNYLLARFL